VRIFLAGATGVIGTRLVPLLVEQGHVVAGMTRSPEKADTVRQLGAEPVVCDVYEGVQLAEAVRTFAPDLVMHQLTDLPDDLKRLALYMRRNNRIRTEGTENLLKAGRDAGAERFIAQSIAFTPPGAGRAVKRHERMVLDAGGLVLRYGWLYGPGTYSESPRRVPPPRIHVDDAARRTVELLDAPGPSVVVVSETEDPSSPA
jgi:nucleoside-diphosphate-sugar epimerase